MGFASLGDALTKTLNKKFKDSPTPITMTGDVEPITKVTDWIPTGCDMLDLSISNDIVGGYPCGRVSILYGKEQSGKSLLGAHALASTQKLGGLAVYIDAEFAFHEGFFNAVGVDTRDSNKWLYVPQNQLEVILEFIDQLIATARELDKKRLITIVLDSFIATHTVEEAKGDFANKGYNTSKSILIGNGLNRLVQTIATENVCLIVTNQVRQKMNAQPFENPWRMPGGQSLPHYASLTVELTATMNIMAEVNGVKRVVGRQTKAKIVKNRLGPPLSTVSFDVYYDRGVDNYGAYLEYMKQYGIGKFAGAYITYVTEAGEEYRSNGKAEFVKLLGDRPALVDEIKQKICEKHVMQYRDVDSSVLENVSFVEIKDGEE